MALWRWARRLVRRWQYRRYLRSAHWQKTRLDAVRRAGYRCERCGAGGRLEVHHRTYARIGHERPGDLAALCRSCHRAAHGR
jgi:5-methylcytosine-specific restriction endonuclease McrA